MTRIGLEPARLRCCSLKEDGHTQVDLEHRYLERHGEGADVVARYVSGQGGWPPIMEGYAKEAAA
jgi:hypothetical protein